MERERKKNDLCTKALQGRLAVKTGFHGDSHTAVPHTTAFFSSSFSSFCSAANFFSFYFSLNISWKWTETQKSNMVVVTPVERNLTIKTVLKAQRSRSFRSLPKFLADLSSRQREEKRFNRGGWTLRGRIQRSKVTSNFSCLVFLRKTGVFFFYLLQQKHPKRPSLRTISNGGGATRDFWPPNFLSNTIPWGSKKKFLNNHNNGNNNPALGAFSGSSREEFTSI